MLKRTDSGTGTWSRKEGWWSRSEASNGSPEFCQVPANHRSPNVAPNPKKEASDSRARRTKGISQIIEAEPLKWSRKDSHQ